MTIEARPWKPQDLLDGLQSIIDEEPDNYLNTRRTTLCMARDYLKEHFNSLSISPLTLEGLLEMDGEPVWDTRWNVWGLLDIGLCRVFTRNGDIDLNIALIEQRLYRNKPSV